MNPKLDIVLDTNVFLVSLSKSFRLHWIYQGIIEGKYNLCISNEILLEYQEIIQKRYKIEITEATLDFLLLLPNVKLITAHYQWNLIEADADDNKFVDCAIASNAHYIVSNDNHFKILKSIPFPKIEVLKAEEFETKFKKQFYPD